LSNTQNKSFYGVNASGNIVKTADYPGGNEFEVPTFTHNGKAYVVGINERKLYSFTPNAGEGTWALVSSDVPYSLSQAKVINGRIFICDQEEQMYEYIPLD
jgi:outer membrane protein assembly factor BamB